MDDKRFKEPKKVEVSNKQARWYFGGVASGVGAAMTHPLDLVKVHLQTSSSTGSNAKPGILQMGSKILKSDGIGGLYSGLSASLLRQATYSLPRFGIYEKHKNYRGADVPFYEKIAVAGVSGAMGGFCGQPADLVNVRMQNDMKLPTEQRRNYANAIDGLIKIMRTEGVATLYNGVSMMASRACLMTVGQAVGYDKCKDFLLYTGFFSDIPATHLLAGVGAAGCATILTQPFDVIKTRLQNSTDKNSSLFSVMKDLLKSHGGPLAFTSFFKGLVPAFIRLGPHTIIIFVVKEQLTIYGGIPKQ